MSNASAPRRAPLLGVSSMLLALFAAGAVVLSSTIPALWVVTQRSERERETAISDACAASIAVQSAAGHPISAGTLDDLRQCYRIEAIVDRW